MSANDPHAPPRGAVRDAAPEGLELAGRGARLLAAIFDGIIAGLMIYVPALIVLLATGALGGPERNDDTMVATAGLLCLIGAIRA